jgi:hypothetical protein
MTHTRTHTRALKFLSLSPVLFLSNPPIHNIRVSLRPLYSLAPSSTYISAPPSPSRNSKRAEPIEACWADRPGRGCQGAYRVTTWDKTLWCCFAASLRTKMTENRQETRRETERISHKADSAVFSPVDRRTFIL